MCYITGVNNSSDVQLFRILPVILSDDRQCIVSVQVAKVARTIFLFVATINFYWDYIFSCA